MFRRAGLETALTILATSLALVPALLLVGAATEPGELAERLIVGIGCPALAVALLWLAPGLRGLAIAVTRYVAGYTQISKITATDPDSFVIPLFGGTLGQGLFRWLASAGLMTTKPNGAPIID